MSIRPLPPLNTLQTFESTARHRSFTAAAHELHITQSAVSRQIKRLEGFLGKALFRRSKTGIELTPSGLRYYEQVQQMLKQLAAETSAVMKWAGEQQITLACSLTVANYWLVPRLAKLEQAHPELQIRILTVEDYRTLEPSDFDIGLYYCLETPEQMQAQSLFDEEVIAICSPAYLRAHPNPPLKQPQDLLRHTLLVLEEHHHDWLTWADWFRTLGVDYRPPDNVLAANNYSLLMNAAMTGQGIALGWRTLLKEYIDSGALVAAVPQSIHSQGKLSLIYPEYRHLTPAVGLLMRWIRDSA